MTLMTSFIKWPKDHNVGNLVVGFRWLVTKVMLLDETNPEKGWIVGFLIENFQNVQNSFLQVGELFDDLFCESVLPMVCFDGAK